MLSKRCEVLEPFPNRALCPPCSPSPRKAVRDKTSLQFQQKLRLRCSSCAAVLGFSSTESITGGYVFRDARAKAIQLQDFCMFLILRLSWAGWLLHKSEQHQALLCPNPPRELPGWAGALGTLGLCSFCLPAAVECPHRNLKLHVCSKGSSKQKITKNCGFNQ